MNGKLCFIRVKICLANAFSFNQLPQQLNTTFTKYIVKLVFVGEKLIKMIYAGMLFNVIIKVMNKDDECVCCSVCNASV